jgi:predicted nuclease with TOPRIM domain
MKSVGLILFTLAVANLLAIAGFVGWLAASDRLDMDRMRKIREMLAVTRTEERAKADEAAVEQKRLDAEQAEKARLSGPPESSAERIEQNRDEADRRQEAASRLRKELDDLRRRLLADQVKLDDERRSFEAERTMFVSQRDEALKLAGSEQFKQALSTLEAQKPKDAHSVLKAMLDGGEKAKVVEYLAAMQDRTRGRVMAEFVKGDAAVAAELLERLRARGTAGLAAAAPNAPATPPAP